MPRGWFGRRKEMEVVGSELIYGLGCGDQEGYGSMRSEVGRIEVGG